MIHSTTIIELYEFIQENPDLLSSIQVETQYGYKPIKDIGITAHDSTYRCIIIDKTRYLYAHPDHMVFSESGGWTPMRNISVGDKVLTNSDYEKVQLSRGYDDERIDLYDIEVDGVGQYFTNGIVSHNSTMSDVIKIGYYGKTNTRTISRIPNRFNKNGEINLSFSNANKKVDILRKFEPTKFHVFEDGIEKDISSKPELQKYIEDVYVNIPYNIFDNMISLSLNDFKSFLKMKPEDKRKIIDRVFSISVINHMRKDLVSKTSDLDKDINQKVHTLTYIESNIKKTQDHIVSLNESLDSKNKQLSDELKEKINENNIFIDDITLKISDLETKYSKSTSKDNKISDEIFQMSQSKKNLKSDIDLLEGGVCPTCNSDLTTDDHKHDINRYKKDLSALESRITEAKSNLDKSRSITEKIYDKINQYRKELNKSQNDNHHYTTKLNEINSGMEKGSEEAKSLQSILDDNKKKLEDINRLLSSLENKKKFYRKGLDLLSDDVIKKSIISNIIPDINKNINEVLDVFDISYNIEFDNNFNSAITEFSLPINISDLSLGESKIFDFCVLISLIKILKNRYNGLNVLFLDEIFASLDPENIIRVVKVLKDVSKEFKLNVFVINHAPLPKEYFDNLVHIKKDRFSEINYVEEF